jgi:hypothetical protein
VARVAPYDAGAGLQCAVKGSKAKLYEVRVRESCPVRLGLVQSNANHSRVGQVIPPPVMRFRV